MDKIKSKLEELETEVNDFAYCIKYYEVMQPGNGERLLTEINKVKFRLSEMIRKLADTQLIILKEIEGEDEKSKNNNG